MVKVTVTSLERIRSRSFLRPLRFTLVQGGAAVKSNLAAVNRARTHEGAPAQPADSPLSELRRAVLSCLLFEDTFYEKGSDIAARISALAPKVPAQQVAALAVESRTVHGLRHVSLFLALTLIGRPGAAKTIEAVINRADELAEIVALYWRDGRRPLAASLKRGIAVAFQKFSADRLSKYDRDQVVKLRDVMFLVHPKPKDEEQAAAFKALANRSLATPDTWEVALSGGGDRKETWTRLLAENKLGALALLRNLRNMDQAGVPRDAIKSALSSCNSRGVVPWQIVGAAQHAPWAESELETLLFSALKGRTLPGSTCLLIDVSGSMQDRLSTRGERTRLDAACALAVIAREVCQSVDVFTFSNQLIEVPTRRGLGLAQAVRDSQGHSGTFLGRAIASLPRHWDRLVVITDEQSHDTVLNVPSDRLYIVNVGPYKPQVMVHGKAVGISGWSDRLLDWIKAHEDSGGL